MYYKQHLLIISSINTCYMLHVSNIGLFSHYIHICTQENQVIINRITVACRTNIHYHLHCRPVPLIFQLLLTLCPIRFYQYILSISPSANNHSLELKIALCCMQSITRAKWSPVLTVLNNHYYYFYIFFVLVYCLNKGSVCIKTLHWKFIVQHCKINSLNIFLQKDFPEMMYKYIKMLVVFCNSYNNGLKYLYILFHLQHF